MGSDRSNVTRPSSPGSGSTSSAPCGRISLRWPAGPGQRNLLRSSPVRITRTKCGLIWVSRLTVVRIGAGLRRAGVVMRSLSLAGQSVILREQLVQLLAGRVHEGDGLLDLLGGARGAYLLGGHVHRPGDLAQCLVAGRQVAVVPGPSGSGSGL